MALETIDEYIASLYAGQESRDQYVQETELKEFIPVVDDDVARLLRLLLHLVRPTRVLEIGTSIGYSTTSMAQIVREYGGKIFTIEFDEQVAVQACKNFERAGVSDCIELLIGDAQEVVPQLETGFDFIFLDVDKRLYSRLLPSCVHLLRQGGILAAEDTDTVITCRSLLPTRNLKTGFSRRLLELEKSGVSAKELRDFIGYRRARKGQLEGDLDQGETFAGSSVGLIKEIFPASRVIHDLVEGYEKVMENLMSS